MSVVNQKETKDTCTKGHRYKTVRTVATTCTKAGYKIRECTRCGKAKTVKTGPALGHKYSTKWSRNYRYHWKKCTREGCKAKGCKAEHRGHYNRKTKVCKVCKWKTPFSVDAIFG